MERLAQVLSERLLMLEGKSCSFRVNYHLFTTRVQPLHHDSLTSLCYSVTVGMPWNHALSQQNHVVLPSCVREVCLCLQREVIRSRGGLSSIPMRSMQQRTQRITRFVMVQYIALAGWVLVQSTFSLSSLGRTIPCALLMVLEAICWIATLLLLSVLFKREYTHFTHYRL